MRLELDNNKYCARRKTRRKLMKTPKGIGDLSARKMMLRHGSRDPRLPSIKQMHFLQKLACSGYITLTELQDEDRRALHGLWPSAITPNM